MKTTATLLLLTATATAQAVNLGGGCAPPMFSTSELAIITTPGGITVQSAWPHTSDYAHLLCIGLDSPAVTLPSCGCTLHTDGIWWAEQTTFSYPPAAAGHAITTQLLIFPRIWGWPGQYLLPDPTGCQEAGFGFRLSDGYAVTLQ